MHILVTIVFVWLFVTTESFLLPCGCTGEGLSLPLNQEEQGCGTTTTTEMTTTACPTPAPCECPCYRVETGTTAATTPAFQFSQLGLPGLAFFDLAAQNPTAFYPTSYGRKKRDASLTPAFGETGGGRQCNSVQLEQQMKRVSCF